MFCDRNANRIFCDIWCNENSALVQRPALLPADGMQLLASSPLGEPGTLQSGL